MKTLEKKIGHHLKWNVKKALLLSERLIENRYRFEYMRFVRAAKHKSRVRKKRARSEVRVVFHNFTTSLPPHSALRQCFEWPRRKCFLHSSEIGCPSLHSILSLVHLTDEKACEIKRAHCTFAGHSQKAARERKREA